MKEEYKIRCLGVGNGSSHVLKGLPSTSFVILKNQKPFILIDCGYGIVKSFLEFYDAKDFPKYIYISHNHSDHTGDLPVLLALYSKLKGGVPEILGHKQVLRIVKDHRLDELYTKERSANDYATWNSGDNQTIDVDNSMRFEIFESQHSYLCYGFRLYVNNVNVLSYTADSGYNSDVYLALDNSPVMIIDGRKIGSYEHASFDEIDKYGKWSNLNKIYIVHYEESDHVFSSKNISLWEKGNVVNLY